ncbi:hypothetical protein AYI68_g6874 [Smittium mucronatum]|uniref:Uncharacterized protein n=1 Tax=Smittium mucronatum TaxID=133383 RepID=A0A1R0GQB8_9FUNG|nr:hypothetical protein AYI68_g6874 [Smittium mucronatum]
MKILAKFLTLFSFYWLFRSCRSYPNISSENFPEYTRGVFSSFKKSKNGFDSVDTVREPLKNKRGWGIKINRVVPKRTGPKLVAKNTKLTAQKFNKAVPEIQNAKTQQKFHQSNSDKGRDFKDEGSIGAGKPPLNAEVDMYRAETHPKSFQNGIEITGNSRNGNSIINNGNELLKDSSSPNQIFYDQNNKIKGSIPQEPPNDAKQIVEFAGNPTLDFIKNKVQNKNLVGKAQKQAHVSMESHTLGIEAIKSI